MRALIFALLLLIGRSIQAQEFDVLVYGGTPGGIAAAIAAAKDGERVLLVEPYSWIGGLVTNGLTHTDFRTFEGLNGSFLEFSRRVEAHYREKHGADSEQVKTSMRGTQSEPGINRAIFEKMIAEQPLITVWRGMSLEAVKCSADETSRAVELTVFVNAAGEHRQVAARYFIDATYEGDLMAAAGSRYRIGRESGAEYGESLAPDDADRELQAYNFRFTMTRDAANRVLPKQPAGYRREDFLELLPLFASGAIKKVFGTGPPAIFKAQVPVLPNGKFDINDVSHSSVRLSLPGANDTWPDGESGFAGRTLAGGAVPPFSRTGLRQSRARVFAEHLRWQLGLLYFVQNDEAVPPAIRDEAREYGWCRDEYPENGHIPEQLYVREARRMVGQYVFSERDMDHSPGDARAILRKDAIAMGDYGPNCHGTGHDGSRFGGKHTGEFYKSVMPYQIPYGVIVPENVENLLVPVAASSTHVGFCALRLEPIWMSLGEAAGHAAHLAREAKVTVQRVPVARLQQRLHETGGATIYVSDVPPSHAEFAMVQWWGTAGGLHGLEPAPAKPGQRGKNIAGQYFEAYPGHGARLDFVLDDATASRWKALATELGIAPEKLPAPDGKLTRGDWLRRTWAAR